MIGIYSGSFNPIHIGHLALANWLCEFEGLDEIWFLVSPHNPLKNEEELMDDRFRHNLVEESIAGFPKFKLNDVEFSLPRPSYSIDTLRALSARYPEHDFLFIMGADNWETIHKWKDYRSLIAEYPILIYPRKGYEVSIPASYTNVKLTQAPIIDISSTFIRQSIKAGKDIRFFLPDPVRHYFIDL